MPQPTPTAWPVRAIWAWPLATASLTTGELLARQSTFDLGATVLAIDIGLACGTWLALLTGLVAIMAARRGWQAPRWLAIHRAAPVLAAFAVASVVVVAAGWIALDAGLELVRTRPLDYPQTGTQLGRALVLLAAPVGVLALVLATGPLTRWLAHGARARFTAAGAGTIAVLVAAHHLGSGSFVVYLGPGVALGGVVLAAIVAASWLPRTASGSAGASSAFTLVVLLATGVAAQRHAGARALLLHHGHLTPTLVDLGFGFLDGDGDGDYPTWLGGGDCDDGDERVGIVSAEIPGNGVDDNCWGGDREAAPEGPSPAIVDGPRPLVVLVTIDTVRPDHLELYGAARETMPTLRALGDRGVVFDRAYAPANHTFYAMTALLAGQATERMTTPQAGQAASAGLRYTRWLPQRLRDLGYYVVAIAPPLVQDGKIPPQELRVDEIDVGPFDSGEKNRGTTSRQIADVAIDRIERWSGTEPLALWIHFMDPHAVHESPVRYPVLDVRDAYDNELSWVDLHLGRVLAAVTKRVGDDALVVVTADHGESFGEDGDWGHGFSLYEREIRVPLVIAGPGVAHGRRTMPVTTLALAPTILGLLGQPRDPGHEYPSLVDADPAPVVAENPAWLWNAPRLEAALLEQDHKLVWSRTTNTIQLFDLAADPDERVNLASRDPAVRERMLETLREALELGR